MQAVNMGAGAVGRSIAAATYLVVNKYIFRNLFAIEGSSKDPKFRYVVARKKRIVCINLSSRRGLHNIVSEFKNTIRATPPLVSATQISPHCKLIKRNAILIN